MAAELGLGSTEGRSKEHLGLSRVCRSPSTQTILHCSPGAMHVLENDTEQPGHCNAHPCYSILSVLCKYTIIHSNYCHSKNITLRQTIAPYTCCHSSVLIIYFAPSNSHVFPFSLFKFLLSNNF